MAVAVCACVCESVCRTVCVCILAICCALLIMKPARGGRPSRAAKVALTSCVKATSHTLSTLTYTHTHAYICTYAYIYSNLLYELWPAPTGRSWRSLRRTNNVISITNQSDRHKRRRGRKIEGGGGEGDREVIGRGSCLAKISISYASWPALLIETQTK